MFRCGSKPQARRPSTIRCARNAVACTVPALTDAVASPVSSSLTSSSGARLKTPARPGASSPAFLARSTTGARLSPGTASMPTGPVAGVPSPSKRSHWTPNQLLPPRPLPAPSLRQPLPLPPIALACRTRHARIHSAVNKQSMSRRQQLTGMHTEYACKRWIAKSRPGRQAHWISEGHAHAQACMKKLRGTRGVELEVVVHASGAGLAGR